MKDWTIGEWLFFAFIWGGLLLGLADRFDLPTNLRYFF